jgi:uncharacterized protein (TIGR03435 family)
MLRHIVVVALFVTGVVTFSVSTRTVAATQSDRAQGLTFEVASVKPSRSPAQLVQDAPRGPDGELRLPFSAGIRAFPGGWFTANVVTLRRLIAWAYDVEDWQIEGASQWMANEYFSIEARAPADATPAGFREMLQSLLADRFKLEARRSTRSGNVHTLVLARSDAKLGPWLTPTQPDCVRQLEERGRVAAAARAEGRTLTAADVPAGAVSGLRVGESARSCGNVSMVGNASGNTTLGVSGATLSGLVQRLAEEERAPVEDRTGLDGLFDYVVDFDSVRPVFPDAGFGLTVHVAAPSKSPLRVAIRDQLGLKLESAEGRVPILLIDAAERPMPD